MIRIFLALIIPFYLFAVYNPYEGLETEKKIELLVNYFLNKELRTKLDPKPIKGKLEDNGPINPTKYERYYNYIQRLKAINEQRIKEQKAIDEKYAGEVGYYNGKLKNKKIFYSKKENILPLIQLSFNKAYKIIYGKPKLKDVVKKDGKIYATLWVDDIYGFSKWEDRKIIIDIPKDLLDQFVNRYRISKVNVEFDYNNNIVKLKDVKIRYDLKNYKASFLEKIKYNIKLNIKIDDDIFRPIKIDTEKK